MINLSRIFCDGMVLQRNMPIAIWGKTDQAGCIPVSVNGIVVGKYEVQAGDFLISLPPQEAMEDVKLEVGEVVINHVDIGEVWLAMGQSNMELEYEYTSDKDNILSNDLHLRMYTVGRYSFENERTLGDKSWQKWDGWYSACDGNELQFSAVGYSFAKKIRSLGIPVGIINSSWGGTSVSAWIDRNILENSVELRSYVDDFEELKNSLNLDVFRAVKQGMRAMDCNPVKSKMMKSMLVSKTIHPAKLAEEITAGMPDFPANISTVPVTPDKILSWGPGDPNEPGALYQYMASEFIGYSIKGAIYYQGESDDHKASIYDVALSTLINSYREEWINKNPSQISIPFFLVQLAPFGMWMGSKGDAYPILREKQMIVADTLKDVYLASISDLGNVFDIHPKEKEPVGNRLSALALKYAYGQSISADAPRAIDCMKLDGRLEITFANASGLYIKEQTESAYNGFDVNSIMKQYLPPVLGGINGLEIIVDNMPLNDAICEVDGDKLIVKSNAIQANKTIQVKFAKSPFYKVNLYNRERIPAFPFVLT